MCDIASGYPIHMIQSCLNSLATDETDAWSSIWPFIHCDRTPCCKISWSLNPRDWILWLSNRPDGLQTSRQRYCRGACKFWEWLEKIKTGIWWFGYFTRSCGKMSVGLVNRGLGMTCREATWNEWNYIRDWCWDFNMICFKSIVINRIRGCTRNNRHWIQYVCTSWFTKCVLLQLINNQHLPTPSTCYNENARCFRYD